MDSTTATITRPSNNNQSSSSDDEAPLFKTGSVVTKSSPSLLQKTKVTLATPPITDAEELAVKLLSVRVNDTRVVNDSAGAFTEYEVVTERSNGEEWKVWRRYREFEALHKSLLEQADASDRKELQKNLPLPPRKWFGHMSTDFVAERKIQLAFYCNQLLAVRKVAMCSLALRSFLKPSLRVDWPASFGPIDLNVHDLPHKSSVTEWWYYNSHLGRFSVFVCFFRIVKTSDKKTGTKTYAHALNWAITDTKTEKYYSNVILDKDSPAMVLEQLKQGSRVVRDATVRAAMVEILEKGNIPLPDKVFKRERKFVSHRQVKLDFEGATMVKDESGAYIIDAHADTFTAHLKFSPLKAPVRHGQNGVVMGHDGDDMFYYFIPRCAVEGKVSVEGETHSVSGDGWYDHEFGGALPKEGEHRMDYAWNWAAIQLENQHEITAAVLVDPKDGHVMETRAVIIDPNGATKRLEDLTFEPSRPPMPFGAASAHSVATRSSGNFVCPLQASTSFLRQASQTRSS